MMYTSSSKSRSTEQNQEARDHSVACMEFNQLNCYTFSLILKGKKSAVTLFSKRDSKRN